jgi:ubiquinone/menaquinone biosynthesis C-methylase UbiE
MTSLKGRMFNRRAAGRRSRAETILRHLPIGKGGRIMDVGSGGGYFTFRFAQAVGDGGLVYAVDTDKQLLESIKVDCDRGGIGNVETAAADDAFREIPKHSLDMVFMRNVTHHLDDRAEYFSRIARLLKPGGRLVVIEYDGRGFGFTRAFGHFVAPDRIIEEAEGAGFRAERSFEFLPEQSFTIFTSASKKEAGRPPQKGQEDG